MDNRISKIFQKHVTAGQPESTKKDQISIILEGLGGKDNIMEAGCCSTRLRVRLKDQQIVDEALLKESGAAAIFTRENELQIVYGFASVTISRHLNNLLKS